MAITKDQRTSYIAYGLIVIGMIGILISGLLLARQPAPFIEGIKSVAVNRDPSSTKPSAASIASYSVALTLPKFITIPAIGIEKTRIIHLGLIKNSEIATPNNTFDTGWYNGSAKPGQPGAMFVYGHVSSWTDDGIFRNLKELKSGDEVIITRGDNRSYTYQVVESKLYPANKVDMKTILSPVNLSQPGLNLMTCAGQFNKATGEFNERLVVFASLVKN